MKFKIVGVLYGKEEAEEITEIAKLVIVGFRAQELSAMTRKPILQSED